MTAPNPSSLSEAKALIQELSDAKRLLELEVARLKQQLFGPRSEKLPLEDRQLPLLEQLFESPEPPATEDVVVSVEVETPKTEGKKPVRRSLPEHLEVVVERLEPQEKLCPHCGQERCVIREECSERLDLIPARLIRRRTIRPVLACGRCKDGVAQAPMPAQVVDKGLCGPGLLAHVIFSKYVDHRPLFRVQQELARLGFPVTRTTLCDWVNAAASALQPLWRRLHAGLVRSDYLQVDETPVKVMDPEVQGKCATGYLWVYGRPGGDVLFDFRTGRSRAGPEEMLKEFEGRLQSDAYKVYPSLVRDHARLRRLGCMAHVRRKFHDALRDNREQALWFLMQFGRLYQIERELRERHADASNRKVRRQAEATPILATIHRRLLELDPSQPGARLLPKSPLGKAVQYALKEWEAVSAYLEDGRYEIDNNLIENAIRPSCVGKKNWMFVGHPDAGWRSAVLYSLLISARRRGHDPFAYLSDVLRRIPAAQTADLDALLPEHWKPSAV